MAVKLIIWSTCGFKGTVIDYVEYYFSKILVSITVACILYKDRPEWHLLCWMHHEWGKTHINFVYI